MLIREVKIISSTRNGVKLINTEASTWGQLKDSLAEFGDIEKMTALVKETRNTLQSNEAVLPDGAFTLYLSPKQIKAGSQNERSVAILESLKDKLSGAIDEIIEEIEDGDYDHLTTSSGTTSASAATVTDEDRQILASLKGL